MKNIILSVLMFTGPITASAVNDINLEPNQSLLLSIESNLVRVNCNGEVLNPTPSPDKCKIETVWGGSNNFIGFFILIDDKLWKKFKIIDYNNNRQTAYIYADRELKRIQSNGICQL